ncbi:YceI family protein [Niabella beijingensis]|uniref:YceI family protein n=1 Tax=Niabella beijingensis TaxID=2872700 RepID=UPI001CBCBC11|nr:YceI family protein [Niabella beijingensis]MBZ4189016.1 YceI family protein [Niabella beijingensis]
MKKTALTICILIVSAAAVPAQRYFTKTGTISFEAGTALEDIEASNKSATSVFDAATGQLEFAVLVKGFEFRRALMQEHFNENYMESSKYPKAAFKGRMNLQGISFQKPGSYPVTVKGTLELHGVKKEITTTGTLKVSGSTVQAIAKFPVTISDYNISIPGVVRDKIAKTALVAVNCNYSVLK